MGTHECELCGKTFYDTEGVFYVFDGSFRIAFCSLSCRNAWQKDNDNLQEEIQRSTNSVAAAEAQRKEAEAVAKAQREAAKAQREAAKAQREAAKAQRDLAAQQREDMEKDHFRPSIEARVGRPLRLDDIVVNPRTGDFVAKTELAAEQQDARECLIRASGVPASVLKECDSWNTDYKLWGFKTSYNRFPNRPVDLYTQQARAAHLNKTIMDVTEADLKRFEKRDDAWWDTQNPEYHTMRMPESEFPPYIWRQPGEMEQNAASYDASAAYIAAGLKKEFALGPAAVAAAEAEAEAQREAAENLEKEHLRPSIEARVGRPLRLDDIVVNPRNGEFLAKTELEAEQQDARECLSRASGVPASLLKECSWDTFGSKLWTFSINGYEIYSNPFNLYGLQAMTAHMNKAITEVTDFSSRFRFRGDMSCWDIENPEYHIRGESELKFPPYIWRQPGEMEQNAASYDACAAYMAAELKKEFALGQAAINRRAKPAADTDLSSSVAGLGHEIADQLKSAVKEQLNQLNPFKGLFRKK